MLKGMVVVEVAYYYPAPYCCKILSDLGARVIKIEPPEGDPMRYRKEIFANFNYGKEIVRINLKSEEGREEFLKIAEKADVVVEGFRPGTVRKLGISYEDVRKVNEGIIYCSISGFGQKSDLTRPIHDINILSHAGIIWLAGLKRDEPVDPNVQLSDLSSSLFSAIAILSAYIRKLRTGEGVYIDLSMYDTAISSIPLHASSMINRGEHLPDFYRNPGYEIYRAKDCYVSFGILDEQKFWDELCLSLDLGYNGMTFEERVRRFDEIKREIEKKLENLTSEEIEKALNEKVPYSIVRSLKDSLKNYWNVREVEFEGEKIKILGFPAKFHTR